MKLKLDHESRVPLRAAVAVSLALAMGELADPRLRGYWAVIVAAVLVTGTWGESTKRGLTRFVMTAVGAAAGWDLHVLFGGHHSTPIVMMLISIFWAVYFRGARYAWFTFFITVYVVFLFDVLEAPTKIITVLRVYQTFIGCALALAAALFVPMPRASEQWEADAREFLRACRAAADRSLDRLLRSAGANVGDPEEPASAPKPLVIPQLNKLRGGFQSASYEGLFDRAGHRRRKAFMERAWQMSRAVIALDHVTSIEVPADALAHFRDDLQRLREFAAWRAGADGTLSPAGNPFDLLRARLDAARREARVPIAGCLVLGAVIQFTSDLARLAEEINQSAPAAV